MLHKRVPIVVLVLAGVWPAAHGSQGLDDDEIAVAATSMAFEMSLQTYDLEKANSLLAPGAQWIENSLPGRADDWGWWWRARNAGIRVAFRVRNVTAKIHGNAAWVTLIIDATFHADSPEGQRLLAEGAANGDAAPSSDPREQTETYVESQVLIRTTAGWRIVLGHTSRLPKAVPLG